MKTQTKLLFILFFSVFSFTLHASHIVSGSMHYECLGNNDYEITMTIYRDCQGSGTPFDNSGSIAIYDGNLLVQDFLIDTAFFETILSQPYEGCPANFTNYCVEKGIYNLTVNLAQSIGTYTIVYQRCCWSELMLNIDSPLERGVTIITEISPFAQAECNMQPIFDYPLSFAACPGEMVTIPIDAYDDEGDSLVYEFCFPLEGAGPGGGLTDPTGDVNACEGLVPTPPCEPPYEELPMAEAFTPENPFPTEDGITFDPVAGTLTFTPTIVGRFIYGICITEYRDGQILGFYRQNIELFNSPDEVINSTTNFQNKNFDFYPNPTSDKIHIIIEDMVTAQIQVTDTRGQILFEQNLADNQTVSLQNLPNGIYFINIQDEGQIFTKRVVKY